MRVLYFSTAVIPSRYANSVHVMKMCSALTENGHDVTLVAIAGDDYDNIDVFDYYGTKKRFDIKFIPNDHFGILRRIICALKYNNYDIIYTRYTLAAFVYGCIFKKSVVYEYHSAAIGKVNRYMEYKISDKMNVEHVFITSSLMSYYFENNKKLHNSKCVILPDGSDEKVKSSHARGELHKFSCGYIGSFQEGKGIDTVIKLAESLSDVTFHVVGGSDEEIKQLMSSTWANNIIWHGHLSQNEAMCILEEEVDVALLPNKSKVLVGKTGNNDIGKWTSPMKLFEYMSYGKAIVASDLPVLKEILTNGIDCLMVNENSIEDWIAAILELKNDHDLLCRLGESAYMKFINNYTWKKRASLAIEYFNK